MQVRKYSWVRQWACPKFDVHRTKIIAQQDRLMMYPTYLSSLLRESSCLASSCILLTLAISQIDCVVTVFGMWIYISSAWISESRYSTTPRTEMLGCLGIPSNFPLNHATYWLCGWKQWSPCICFRFIFFSQKHTMWHDIGRSHCNWTAGLSPSCSWLLSISATLLLLLTAAAAPLLFADKGVSSKIGPLPPAKYSIAPLYSILVLTSQHAGDFCNLIHFSRSRLHNKRVLLVSCNKHECMYLWAIEMQP